jgi:hypothetical protein
MKQVNYHDYNIQVNNGQVFSDNAVLQKLAEQLLAGTFGKFNNSEVYPDKDSAIAHYIQEALRGK